MAQLFAGYLTQKMVPDPVLGEYDPEQELWVGDNQLQGATRTNTGTHTKTTKGTFTGPGPQFDRDTGTDSDGDTDFDSDNP